MAAILSLRYAVAKTVNTVNTNEIFNGALFGKIHYDLTPIVIDGALDQIIGFDWQTARVDGKNIDSRRMFGDEIHQHHVFSTQAIGKGDRRMIRRDLFKGLLSL